MITKQDLKITSNASSDNTRPVIAAVQVKAIKVTDPNGGAFNTPGGYAIRLAATDGYRLTEKMIPVEDKPDFEEMLIPAKRLGDIAKLMTSKDNLEITKEHFIITDFLGAPKAKIEIGQLTDGQYPEYDQLIPDKNKVIIACSTLNAKYMIKALEQVDPNNSSTFTLELYEGKFTPVLIRSTRELTGEIISIVMPLKS
jgi:hypothetical protein